MRPLKLIVKHSPSELLTFILTYHHHEYETEFVKPIFRCASTCCTDGLDSLTDSLTDSLIETGDCQFIMFDNSPTTSLVFYPKGMICLVSLIIPVSLVTLVSLVIQVSHISLVSPVSLATLSMVYNLPFCIFIQRIFGRIFSPVCSSNIFNFQFERGQGKSWEEHKTAFICKLHASLNCHSTTI